MNPNDEELKDENKEEDKHLAELFAAAQGNETPPNEDFLAQLRERSTREFEAEPQKNSLPAKKTSLRESRMYILAIRGLATAVAVAVLTLFWNASRTDNSSASLGVLIENVATAETAQLQLVRFDQTHQVWTRRPNEMRIDAADGTYQIARQEKLWTIDEKANRARVSPSPFYSSDQVGLNPLALLGIDADDPDGEIAKRLRQAKPVEQVDSEGILVNRYELDCVSATGPVRLVAFADALTRSLRSLTAMQLVGGQLVTIAEVKVIALNDPVDEELFVVGDTLTEDGRIGKVTDVQGTVAVRPVMQKRWSPLVGQMLLKPGDWVRTDTRGANAVALRLMPQTMITLGPGTLVELASPQKIKLLSGELKIEATKETPIELIGPGDTKITIAKTTIIRLQQDQFVRLEKEPLWLTGFEGTTSNESLGSLLANVDGRDVPLTVGYHRVKVDIRDQIARTVIEESFVNHTNVRTEGVFYFPLPQDASISGFAMWIGGEKVTADIVEKQRAREIYETILRERRDPGLLEWTGGNIFKARVFPIEPRSEKRIEISYTQVLPLRGNQYRFSYGLRSEMLQQNPLRELGLDVTIHSALPLAAVSSPTHTARIDQTGHSAHVEFSAQEYTPTRDFEVVVELEDNAPPVVMIPHQRGEDGYFLLQLKPPAADNAWQREVVTDTGPLDLLILADTSASMDDSSRRAQAEFVASLLGAMTPEDKFNLAGCDVTCDWVFARAVAASEANVEKARKHLEQRISLGWTNLDQTFAAAFAQCGPRTRVVYVGDGIVTGLDSDPVAFGKRLREMAQGHTATFHAVSTSSSFEPVVLKTIGSLGGGSMLEISGERGPQAVALELLSEITKPTIRDIKVEFRGLQTARVYPEQLPNLAPGTQQILLGRYLPETQENATAEQSGQVVVTGMLGDKPVRFAADVSLKEAEQGNSFIPRLWARMHLDELLEQGTSQAIQDEIVGLSEEYHIMTPYTSLLVLETDADRERFKVERRFQMRDGERFFADGRDNANYELVQQQMRLAGNWRVGLRRSVLQQLHGLGRDSLIAQRRFRQAELYKSSGSITSGGWDSGIFLGVESDESGLRLSISGKGREFFSLTRGEESGGWYEDAISEGEITDYRRKTDYSFGSNGRMRLGDTDEQGIDDWGSWGPIHEIPMDFNHATSGPVVTEIDALRSDLRSASAHRLEVGFKKREAFSRFNLAGELFAGSKSGGDYGSWSGRFDGIESQGRLSPPFIQWLENLFPNLPTVPTKYAPPQNFKPWPTEVRKLTEGLLRTKQLSKMDGGLIIDRKTENFDARWGDLVSNSETVQYYSPQAWLIRSGGHGSQTLVEWCNAQKRGVFGKGLLLGRIRDSEPRDLSQPPLTLDGNVMASLERTYWSYQATIEKPEDARNGGEKQPLVTLTLKHPTSQDYEVRYTIDTQRNVLVKTENIQMGEVTNSTVFSEFVEVVGTWWATRSETFDKDGRRTSMTTQKFKQATTDELQRLIDHELADRDKAQLLTVPLPTLDEAKKARDEGTAAFEHQIVLMLHFAASQQWDRVAEHLEAAEKISGDKSGLFWLRNLFLQSARRHEELQDRILKRAADMAQPRVAGQMPIDEYFLAELLRGQANGVLEANEMLELLDTLRPLYERQDALLLAMKTWNGQRMNYLRNTGQQEMALALQKELAQQYPRDYSLQQQYAQALVNARRFDEAVAWLDSVLVKESKWLAHEEETLRNVYAAMLANRGDYPALVEYLAAWSESNPESGSLYQQYLAALVRADREEEANDMIAKWLAEGQTAEELSPAAGQRLDAAVRQALGGGYNLRTNRIEERWRKPLTELVLFMARLEKPAQSVQDQAINQVMNHYQFQQTDDCRKIRREIAPLLVARIDTLSVARIQQFYNWIAPHDPVVEDDVWQQIVERLMKRWAAEEDEVLKQQLAQPLIQILANEFGSDHHLAFLRRQLAEGPPSFRPNHAQQLFNLLIDQPWSPEFENEAFAILEQLSDVQQPQLRLAVKVQALLDLTDAMVRGRCNAWMAEVEHPEQLKRLELRKKQTENLRKARTDFADQLAQQIKLPRDGELTEEFEQWLTIEKVTLDILTEQNLDRARDACWKILGPQPLPIPEEVSSEFALAEKLRERCLTTLTYLAARKDAEPALVEKLLRFCNAGIDMPQESLHWKMVKYQLLVALDRADELEQHLRDWIRPDQPDRHWRRALAYLLAEQGKIEEAISHFELIETADELAPSDYSTLANWYLVLDQRKDHQQAKIAMYQTMQEYQISNWLSQRLGPWQQSSGPLPEELDAEILIVFQALFGKSENPHYYLSQLRDFYRATRDFRLPAGLPDAVMGHTVGKVYPFLQGMGTVLSEIREEATADRIVARISEVHAEAKTAIDRRALDLLELLIERRAAELLNQPGPHGKNALAAMQRAFEHEWSGGELRLMADFLANLGAISDTKLAEEQLRELEILHGKAQSGTIDRLHIAHKLAQTHWNYSRRTKAIDVLTVALDEFQTAHDGVLPTTANDMLRSLVLYLNQTTHFAQSEEVLLGSRERNKDPQQEFWLVQLLYETYEAALQDDGEVSIGKGKKLFDTLEERIREDLNTTDHNHRYQLLSRLCSIYRTSHRQKIVGVIERLRDFADNQIPGLLAQQTNNYQSIVMQVADVLKDLVDVCEGLAFLVTRIEQEPSWFRLSNDDGWRHHGHRLGDWRREAGTLGQDLEERLLKIVVDELKLDLRSQQSRSRSMYHDHHSYFWKEKADMFARAAEQLLVERKNSGAATQYISEYFNDGLDRHNRAIAILFVALDAELLDEGGQSTLVNYLHERSRFGESIAVLKGLVKRAPDNIDYRCQLLHAYFRTERKEELLELLKVTDTYFHDEGRWNEQVIAKLASSCLQNHLFSESVTYYQELIPLHEASQPNRGVGNGTLSTYYTSLAKAFSGLKNTDEAVKAAGAAIVSWGPRHENRQQAVETLRRVVRNAHDLDAYVTRLDKEAAETKLHNPIVRLAIGQAYQDMEQFEKAIVQLELAVELQPNDKETHKALVACYDKQGDKQGAINRIFASLQLARRDLELYEDLGNRLTSLERTSEAERAYTSMVEMLPNESESHTALARIRQRQSDWDAAVGHWREVIRIRSLEPDGLIGLAKAQIGQQQWDAASKTVEKISKSGWPSRFDNLVANETQTLRRQIEQKQNQ